MLSKPITAAFFFLGLLSITPAKAVIYTHTLQYDLAVGEPAGDTLSATVTFDSANQPVDTVNGAFDSNFITNLTYIYTPVGEASQTVNYSAFTDGDAFDLFSFDVKDGVTVNFGQELKDQLDNLQFGQTDGTFNLGMDATPFQVNAGVRDFVLSGTTYQSPAPLPLLGIIPAFSSISRLKKRYKLKNNS